jgi:hypothetical protein
LCGEIEHEQVMYDSSVRRENLRIVGFLSVATGGYDRDMFRIRVKTGYSRGRPAR